MRRIAVVAAATFAAVMIATPAYAVSHDRVANPWLHTVLDVLTFAVVTAPMWTAYAWGGERRGALLGLVTAVQIPVAVFAFVPIADPVVHAVALVLALSITASSLWYVRGAARAKTGAAHEATVGG